MKFAFLSLLGVLVASPALAHQSSVAFTDLSIADDRQSAKLKVQVSTRDLAEALELPEDREATAEEIAAGSDKLYKYISNAIAVSSVPAMECEKKLLGVKSVTFQDTPYVAVSWDTICDSPIAVIRVDYDLFFDIDAQHTSPLTAAFGQDKTSILLSNAENRFEWELAEPPPSGFMGFLRSGVEHILFGPDHILFLVSLLLVVAITSAGGTISIRGTRLAIRYTLALVTSFTIAHSITLVAAALGFIPIHPKLVESIIALSIVYVAVENLIRPDPKNRAAVTFVFGLLHGMGFASMLRVLLPSEGLVMPVLSFNLGVELGQLAIVLVLLPILLALARAMGPERYRKVALPIGCVGIGILGLLWLIERAFELSIIS